MTDFIEYSTSVFSTLNSTRTIIIKADKNTCYVNSLIICNTSNNTITINLTKVIFKDGEQDVFLIKNFELPSASGSNLSTVDIIKQFGLEIFLPVFVTEEKIIPTALRIYSGGINQNFDCTVDYSILTELPFIEPTK